ncbi:hypothetical protein [Methylorubrum zatmanii]|uniref:RiboL-PSP-HEPN domain-containing protein n=1 Tax=Methylorubrum zatmanii TaxID=29429 RepID=A0ABW1WHQ9_9HYPH|nr:hypothetical protein [Methylorubrum zatmanii]
MPSQIFSVNISSANNEQRLLINTAGAIQRQNFKYVKDGMSIPPNQPSSLGPRSSKLQRDLTQAEKEAFAAPNISGLFKNLNSGLNEIWEDYLTINYYLGEVHTGIKRGKLPRVTIDKLVHRDGAEPAAANTIYGILSRFKNKSLSRHAFIDGVSLFELFMSRLTFLVHIDYPAKLKGLANDQGSENESRKSKLIDMILDSSDRHEIIHKLIEEKVRGIFYGNPVDLFKKDKARIGFGTYFKDNHTQLLEAFKEITARRNIIIHNESRVDRKYLLEVETSSLKLGSVADITEDYLKTSLLVMKDLGAASAQRVANSVYKQPLGGIVKKIEVAAKKHPPV